VFSRVVQVFVSLATVPIALKYLGAEEYGIWATLSTLLMVLAFGDLGIGNSLVNLVSTSTTKGDTERARATITSAMIVLLFVSTILATLLLLANSYLDLGRLLNVHSTRAVTACKEAITAVAVVFAVSLPLQAAQRIHLALQQAHINSIFTALGNGLALVALLCAVQFDWGLPGIVLSGFGAQTFCLLLSGLFLFLRSRPDLIPVPRLFDWSVAKVLLKEGGLFFAIQLASIMAFWSDNILISMRLSPEQVTGFSIPAKLFNFLPTFISVALLPVWPAFREALHRGDTEWIRKTFKRALYVSGGLTSLAAVPLILFGRPIVHAWSAHAVYPSLLLLAGLGMWSVQYAVGSCLAVFLNGFGALREQVYCALGVMVVAVSFKLLALPTFGIACLPWIMCAAHLVIYLIPLALSSTRFLKRGATTTSPNHIAARPVS